MHTHSGQPTVDVSIAAAEEVTICGAQVPVEEGVYEGVHEGVSVAQPEQSALQPDGHTAALDPTDKGPGCGQDEEWQPAHSEHPHNDP